MFGINGPEFLVLALVALLVVGPERLPKYASQLARLVREVRRMATGAREQVRAELGPEFDDIDWKKLDPRQYDPRRIIREALSDVDPFAEPAKPVVARAAVNENSAYLQRKRKREALGAGEPAPFDTEAT